MPAEKTAGSTRIDQTGRPCAAPAAETPSSPTSVAVSKPSPNSSPTQYIWALCSTRRNVPLQSRASRPPGAPAATPTNSPARAARKPRQVARSMARLAAAIASRNSAEMLVPITPPTACR